VAEKKPTTFADFWNKRKAQGFNTAANGALGSVFQNTIDYGFPMADLSVPSFSTGSISGIRGLTIDVTDTTRVGANPAPLSATAYYFSTDNSWDPNDIAAGFRSVPALGANGSSTGTTTVTIPNTLTS